MVMVDPVVEVTDRLVGETATVDSDADIAPVKVTVTVLDKLMPSVVSVAKIVLFSALVVLMLLVACPLASVGAAGCVTVLPVPVDEMDTFLPGTGLLY